MWNLWPKNTAFNEPIHEKLTFIVNTQLLGIDWVLWYNGVLLYFFMTFTTYHYPAHTWMSSFSQEGTNFFHGHAIIPYGLLTFWKKKVLVHIHRKSTNTSSFCSVNYTDNMWIHKTTQLQQWWRCQYQAMSNNHRITVSVSVRVSIIRGSFDK